MERGILENLVDRIEISLFLDKVQHDSFQFFKDILLFMKQRNKVKVFANTTLIDGHFKLLVNENRAI